ncbi:MAG: DUF2130 domain-containing protein [Muribaculaceae bacterium]|nr:DUF2130 domain-containing protein [Muribaculaceae bacterium]
MKRELKCPNCQHTFQVDDETFESLATQIRTAAFDEELSRRVTEMRDKFNSELKFERMRQQQQQEKTHAALELKITELQAQIDRNESMRRVAILEEQNRAADTIRAREQTIAELRNRVEQQAREAALREQSLREQHATDLRRKDDTIEYYKDLKTRLSTKMIGETLEQHCQTVFDQAQAMGVMPNARLEKDNTVIGGTKGDFTFRDFDEDGEEYISIMFEMKNESDTTSTKHRNADFLEKLDQDRNKKNCEYAVLVSLLEKDNELYNDGIVNMSHRFPKMYVIRPQMFMVLISLLSQAARKNRAEIVSLRHQLVEAKAQSLEVSTFEQRRDKLVQDFSAYIETHLKKHNDAMDGIDKVIATLEKQIEALRKVKETFGTSQTKLVKAGEVMVKNLTIRKLTRGLPDLQQKFNDARSQSYSEDTLSATE